MSSRPGFVVSMTGFARAQGRVDPYRFQWELKTVNSKGLDLRFRLPAGYDSLEPQARTLLSHRLARGACNVSLTLERDASASAVRINTELLRSLLQALESVPVSQSVRAASLDGLLGVRGVVEATVDPAAASGQDALTGPLLDVLQTAADALADMRRSEGARLAEILGARLATIEDLAASADRHPARRPDAVRARLTRSVQTLLDASATFDVARLHQEAVLLAAKSDIQEEVDRLSAHVAAARGLLIEGGPIGRRLDFLAQELAREANTLCAKANDVSLTAIGLDLRSEIEQFREQVQNVE